MRKSEEGVLGRRETQTKGTSGLGDVAAYVGGG